MSPLTLHSGNLTWGISASPQRKATFLCFPHKHSPLGATAGWWWWWWRCSSKVWVFCSALTCPAQVTTQCWVWRKCAARALRAQLSSATSHLRGGLLTFEQTHSHRIPHKAVQFTWPGQITNLTLASGYFLCCLLIYRLSIKINACFTLISGNLGLHYQQSCLGQASLLPHCTSERLLYFPYLFSRKVIFLCCMYVFNCSHEIHDMLVSHPIWPFWKHPFSFFKEH